ncbi:MAG: hypothetical protein HWD61_01100 [Parachlamydiaceae bacterium]|nr:MAG: hypothetical protein HWD61_01100 [Parachlamydiaceae bacterium]
MQNNQSTIDAQNALNNSFQKHPNLIEELFKRCNTIQQMEIVITEGLNVNYNVVKSMSPERFGFVWFQSEGLPMDIGAKDFFMAKVKAHHEFIQKLKQKYTEEEIYQNPFKPLDVDFTKLDLNMEEEGIQYLTEKNFHASKR